MVAGKRGPEKPAFFNAIEFLKYTVSPNFLQKRKQGFNGSKKCWKAGLKTKGK